MSLRVLHSKRKTLGLRYLPYFFYFPRMTDDVYKSILCIVAWADGGDRKIEKCMQEFIYVRTTSSRYAHIQKIFLSTPVGKFRLGNR